MKRNRGDMNLPETIAKRVVEHILPGSTMHYRRNQSTSTYDFDLRHRDGDAAMEVTMAANKERLETIAAIRKQTKGGPVVKATRCSKSWRILPRPAANINRIRESIDSYLAPIEAEGYINFVSELDYVKSEAIRNILHDLQIERGSVYAETERQIFIELPGQWGQCPQMRSIASLKQKQPKRITEKSWQRITTAKDISLSTSILITICYGKSCTKRCYRPRLRNCLLKYRTFGSRRSQIVQKNISSTERPGASDG
jgi:hypothetical protein